MEQTDLLDWLESKKVIVELPPAQQTQHRRFIIEQLKPILKELETLNISNGTISEALSFYQKLYQEKAQKEILKPTE